MWAAIEKPDLPRHTHGFDAKTAEPLVCGRRRRGTTPEY